MGGYFTNKTSDFFLESIEGLVASIPHLRHLNGFPEVSLTLFFFRSNCLEQIRCRYGKFA